MALNHKLVFADKKAIICVLCFTQFVVYSMQNPLFNGTAKKVVFCYLFKFMEALTRRHHLTAVHSNLKFLD